NNVFRKFLTETAAELYPDLVMEQAICIPPFNGADHNEARVLKRFAENKKLNNLSIAATDFSEVFRTYDVSPPLSVATTLDRAAGLLPTARGYLNVEDELYIGAALGCQVGIMRSAFGKGADAWDDSDRLREADAAVAWQKIAPPFVGGTSKTGDEILTDEYEFGKAEMWFDKVNGKNIRQGAPASVARNCELPNITAGESGYKPFVAAARNPAGAYSVAVLPRTVKGIKRKYVGGEVRCKSVAATDKIALFGTAERVVFELDKKITRVTARSLFGGAPTDISHSILSSRNGFAVDEKTVNELNNADDRSAPAIMFEVQ
ncbi:MAG: hypothetical protein K2L54_05665, partial [Clostridiales bacterium]|nr:hypothetical protein [Clostridiales bacterium]